ncbi:UDP-N-acetylmuramate--L-alanine ligase [Gaopeijia maritima]|uniref:Mur ligase family protein n=1 Tax=Gaopeijia maritima TaxID=3119007 RepID=A0ABU9E6Y8_9BACT
MHYHLIGIAGTAMGSLAGLLAAKGHRVTGSDHGVYPPMSTLLDDMGIPWVDGFSPDNLTPTPDRVVVGNAISRGNVELEAVLDRRLFYTSAADTIKNEFLRDRRVLAVAGTHGKTTTTSILSWLLECAGLEPSFLIGGVAENFGTSFRLTDSDLFVIEADEYDTAYFDKGPKMWHYLPHVGVVTNVEFDHADIYRDDEAYRFAFERFVNLVPRSGRLVVGWDTPVARELAAGAHAPVVSVGLPSDDEAAQRGADGKARVPEAPADDAGGASDAPAPIGRWRADAIEAGPDGTRFTVVRDGTPLGRVTMPLSGVFNVRNAMAALAAGEAVGAEVDAMIEGLTTFRTVRRRMEVRGEAGGVIVIDDFAHHPTAVGATLEAVRDRFPGRRIVAVFEPRSYTAQLRRFQEGYRGALARADRVWLAGLFRPERYDATTGLDPVELSTELTAQGIPADHRDTVPELVEGITADAAPGDVVVVMSNGGFGGIHGRLLEALGNG